ncbi:ABC transporter permease [Microbacterium pseudoresistens]|uniref:Peptide/nickel transport system permease protein n=1 Tax=Microbacterium pseudoresistens TaxID=640634 RepID=A0A7Y9JM74_9MICO|nr:ABC transporter permease [Microbacterium pseudoresistens]NYD53213.1 peptide/nickel transport system permease protein [Microbacterium pseudoresistens]
MSTATTTIAPLVLPPRDSTVTRLVRVLRTDWLAVAGLAIVLLVVVLAFFGRWIAPYPEQGMGQTSVDTRNIAPGLAHLFGTDQLGRDILSRVIMGANPALTIAVAVVGLAALIGVPLGAIAGYRGGWLDNILMRITEVFQAFPPLLLAMVMVALLGPSLLNAGLALAICWWPWYARLVRAEARSLRERPYVEAARAIGVPAWRILPRHILRNCLTPVIVQATVDVGAIVLAAGSLAFLGLGAQPPAPDWGLMVAEGRGQIFTAWWISTFPGLAIFLTVLGFNLIGDALRDLLDPRQVKR